MAQRSLSLGFFGLLTGLMLGTGTLVYMQQTSLQGSVSSLPVYTRREINLLGVPLRGQGEVNNYSTVKTSSSSVSSVAASADATPCTAVQGAVAKIKLVYNAVVPVNLTNTSLRAKMDAAFAGAVNDYCIQNASATSSVSSVGSAGTTATVDNHCEVYPSHSVRYTECLISNGLGKKYP